MSETPPPDEIHASNIPPEAPKHESLGSLTLEFFTQADRLIEDRLHAACKTFDNPETATKLLERATLLFSAMNAGHTVNYIKRDATAEAMVFGGLAAVTTYASLKLSNVHDRLLRENSIKENDE